MLRLAPCGSKRTVKVHVLCPPSSQFVIIRYEQRQCFEDIWAVVHEKKEKNGPITEPYGAIRCIGMVPECSPPTCTLETRPERYVLIHRTTTSPRPKDFTFCHKKFVIEGVKGLGKNKVDDINCVTLVHNASHRFLED